MKKLYFLLLSFSVGSAVAQQVVVANLKENIVYCGIDNPLSALVEGYPCSSVVLTTDGGKINKTGCGQFNFISLETGPIKIKVWIRQGKTLKKINEITYRTKTLPLPVAWLTYMEDGRYRSASLNHNIRKHSVRAGFMGIRASLKDFNYDAPFQIISFDISGVRSKEILFTKTNKGSVIDFSLFNDLDSLKVGDTLLINSIICIGPDGNEKKLQPIEFIITD